MKMLFLLLFWVQLFSQMHSMETSPVSPPSIPSNWPPTPVLPPNWPPTPAQPPNASPTPVRAPNWPVPILSYDDCAQFQKTCLQNCAFRNFTADCTDPPICTCGDKKIMNNAFSIDVSLGLLGLLFVVLF